MAEARQEAMDQVEAARREIAEEADAARDQLKSDAEKIAEEIAQRLLGRPVESEEERG